MSYRILAVLLAVVFTIAITSADQKGKKATPAKKEMKSCCMEAKASMTSNEKSSANAMNARHEHGKGMDACADGKDCKEMMSKMNSKVRNSTMDATNAKHEHGKGMECDMDHCVDKDGKMSAKHGKDCCKEMTKAENTRAETKSGSPAPKE